MLCGSWSIRLVPRRRTCIVIIVVVVVGWGSSPTCRCGTRRASGRGRWCSGRFQKQKVYYQSDEGKHQRHKVRKQLLVVVFYGGHDSLVIVRRRKQSVKKSFPSSLCLCVCVCVCLFVFVWLLILFPKNSKRWMRLLWRGVFGMWYSDDTYTRCDVDKREREVEESKERSISGEKACGAQS